VRASKETKTKILDELIANTGMHRKAAIQLLNRFSGTSVVTSGITLYHLHPPPPWWGSGSLGQIYLVMR
jgi:hypothetical protein